MKNNTVACITENGRGGVNKYTAILVQKLVSKLSRDCDECD